MLGFRFTNPTNPEDSLFKKLFDILMQLLVHTNGDFDEAIDWLRELDKEYELTNPDYTVDDFVNELKEKGYIKEKTEDQGFAITSKTEKALREKALERIFGKLKKSKNGNHATKYTGKGDELTGDLRAYEFGDSMDQVALLESIKNAQINHGIDEFFLAEKDLEVSEKIHKTQTSTVLMIDISHSMILYGEDRITPAKNVAMALAELIKRKYPKDTLDIIVFGNDAWQITVRDIPYLQVGPYHTNTVAGLELAMDILRKRKNSNRQIFMITDGKPTCLKIKGQYYKNSNGLDETIVNRCLTQAKQCKKLKIPITTFMIANDPYLQKFVRDFTAANAGKAYFSSLEGLGDFIFEDFERNKKRKV